MSTGGKLNEEEKPDQEAQQNGEKTPLIGENQKEIFPKGQKLNYNIQVKSSDPSQIPEYQGVKSPAGEDPPR